MAGARGIRAGRAYVELGVNNRLSSGLRRASAQLKAFGAGVRSIGMQVAMAGAVMAAPFILATRQFAKMGDEVDKISKRTGVSAEALSELGFAAEQAGANMPALEKGIRTMQRSINDLGRDLSTQVDAFTDLGLTMKDLDGLSPEDQFKRIADAISKLDDPTKKAALALMIFGRAGTQLLPMMNLGIAGMEAYQDQARALGLTISTDAAGAAAVFTDQMNVVKKVLKTVAFEIGSALVPGLGKTNDKIIEITVSIRNWIKDNKAFIVSAFKLTAVVIGIGAALVIIGTSIIFVGFVLQGLAAIIGLFASAFGAVLTVITALFTPLGAMIALVAGLGGAMLHSAGVFKGVWEFLKNGFAALGKIIKMTFGGMADALAAGDLALAAQIGVAGMKLAWIKGTNELKMVWSGFVVGLAQVWEEFAFGFETVWKKTMEFSAGVTTRFLRWLSDQFKGTKAGAWINLFAQISGAATVGLTPTRSTDLSTRLMSKGGEQAADRYRKEADELDRLLALLNKAKAARDAAGGFELNLPDMPEFEDFSLELSDAISKSMNQFVTRGTFNARAILGLEVGGENFQKQTADNTKSIEQNTRDLEQWLREGSITFA